MKVKDLPKNFYLFGNKGNVWSNTSHIASVGSSTTLCGTPMLSSNWAKIENIQNIGCPSCLKIYKKTPK